MYRPWTWSCAGAVEVDSAGLRRCSALTPISMSWTRSGLTSRRNILIVRWLGSHSKTGRWVSEQYRSGFLTRDLGTQGRRETALPVFLDDRIVIRRTNCCRDRIPKVRTMTHPLRLGGEPQWLAVLVQHTRSFIMSRIHTLAAALAFSAFAMPAFSDNGFTPSNTDSGGAYHAMPGGKTRAEVKAELAAAIKDGSLAKMNSEAGYAPEFETPARAAQSRNDPSIKQQLAKGDGQIVFEPTAAGGRTRAEVLLELQRAREDGSLRRMNTNRGY